MNAAMIGRVRWTTCGRKIVALVRLVSVVVLASSSAGCERAGDAAAAPSGRGQGGDHAPAVDERPTSLALGVPTPPAASEAAIPAASGADASGPSEAAGPDALPCGEVPEGMTCVPGGWFVRGTDDGPPNARPRARVWLQTFYVDRFEVTHAAFMV